MATPQYQITPPEGMDCRKPEDWSRWVRRFERFREASGLSTKLPAEQVNTLVYCMGEEADDILTSLHLTEDENGSYEVVKQKFDTYFNGSKNVIFERARFNQRRQEADESVDEFVTALHRRRRRRRRRRRKCIYFVKKTT